MKKSAPLIFLTKAVIAGLAAAFLILLLRPDLLGERRPIVQVHEAQTISAGPSSGPVSYAAAVESAAPAVVNVYTTKVVTEQASPLFNDPFFRYFFGDRLAPRQRLESSLGSGVIVSDQGYILTNNHVVEGATGIEVLLRDGRSAEAQLVGTDPESDVAVLKVDLDNVPTITFRGEDGLRVGDVVLAIGNPFGLDYTLTTGIISALGREIQAPNNRTIRGVIQTDAAINRGNSGGPLLDSNGRLIGVNTAIYSPSGTSAGIGLAIPVNKLKQIVPELIRNGRFPHPWLGLEGLGYELYPELAQALELPVDQGLLIAQLYRNSPAVQAGLRGATEEVIYGRRRLLVGGDILTAINGVPLRSWDDLDAYLQEQTEVGQMVTLTIWRGDQEMTIEVKLGEMPEGL